MERSRAGQLSVATSLYDFVNDEALPGTEIGPEQFWSGFGALIADLAPRNRELLDERDRLQARIDAYHRNGGGKAINQPAYEAFLRDIGYLRQPPADFSIRTSRADDEIAKVAGPQLVVPITNARYSLNAANARWGSLYDALYGTDAIAD